MNFLRRLWARARMFFVRATPQLPERLEPRPPISDRFENIGPYQKLEAHESTHVVGMRNPKMTGRTSKTHPPRPGVMLQQDHARANLQREAITPRPGEVMECTACGAWVPPADIGTHDCDDENDAAVQRDRAEVGQRVASAGSQDFDVALSNVRYLDPKRRKDADE